jgi:hypothetical protein
MATMDAKMRRCFEAISQALFREWDPIGVNTDAPADEYDNYVPQVYELLANGASHEETFRYLWSVETEQMGLQGRPDETLRFTDRLFDLRDELRRQGDMPYCPDRKVPTAGKKRRGSMTAEALMAELGADPYWVATSSARDKRLAEREAHFRELETPIVADLASIGCIVDSVWDLVNTSEPYPEAIEVLIRHLGGPYEVEILQGIARALTVKEARGSPAREILKELHRRRIDGTAPLRSELRWVLANALTVVADDSMANEIKEMLADPENSDIEERLRLAYKALRRRR